MAPSLHFNALEGPTVIELGDGKEAARPVRPADAGAIREALAQIDRL